MHSASRLLVVLLLVATPATACLVDGDCVDATVCNGAETCVAGACQPDTPLDCNDTNSCTIDSCNPATGCLNTPLANNTSCSDGDVCNGPETCQGGLCTPGTPPNCADASPCTIDSCDSLAGHCVYTPVANGTPCADTNVCNGSESCQGGLCAPGTALDCSDGNDCTADTCNPLSGCAHTVATDGTVCGDDNPCTGTETCLAGTCMPGIPIPEGGSCDDGNVCNGAEICQSSVCAPGTALDCDDGNVCTDDACHITLGCLHDIAICEDANPITLDLCVPITGCEFHALVPGHLLLLRANPANPTRTKMRVVAAAAGPLANPPPNGGPSDPVVAGASLRVVTNAFDHTYPLPAGHWTYIGRPGDNNGYRYRDKFHEAGPIIALALRSAGLSVASGKGQNLQFTLPSDPDPVQVVLRLGATKYCMSFGGEKRFVPDNQFFKARNALAPAACPL